jgi:hypothetical protein
MGLATMAIAVALPCAWANNVAVTNTTLLVRPGWTACVRFDVSWENSWRDEVNHDAVWLFAKYSSDGGASWHHATLASSGTNPPGFYAGTLANAEIYVPADRMGAFLQRTAAGSGHVTSTNVSLVWDYAANGLTPANSARVKVMAVEMVHIPQGPFYAGDDTSLSSFYVTYINTADITKTNQTWRSIRSGHAHRCGACQCAEVRWAERGR